MQQPGYAWTVLTDRFCFEDFTYPFFLGQRSLYASVCQISRVFKLLWFVFVWIAVRLKVLWQNESAWQTTEDVLRGTQQSTSIFTVNTGLHLIIIITIIKYDFFRDNHKHKQADVVATVDLSKSYFSFQLNNNNNNFITFLHIIQ